MISNLDKVKSGKKDEFYTQLSDTSNCRTTDYLSIN